MEKYVPLDKMSKRRKREQLANTPQDLGGAQPCDEEAGKSEGL